MSDVCLLVMLMRLVLWLCSRNWLLLSSLSVLFIGMGVLMCLFDIYMVGLLLLLFGVLWVLSWMFGNCFYVVFCDV